MDIQPLAGMLRDNHNQRFWVDGEQASIKGAVQKLRQRQAVFGVLIGRVGVRHNVRCFHVGIDAANAADAAKVRQDVQAE